MKGIFFIFLLTLSFITASSQSYQWAQQGSSEGYDYGNAMVVDDSGNVYITGQIEFSALFGNYTLNSAGKHDIYIAKYASNGNLLWAKRAGGRGGDVSWGIGIDADHNSYIAGEYELTCGFAPGDTLTASGANDIFFAKYNANGDFVDNKRYGGGSDDKARALTADPNGDVYITGYFSGTASFGSFNLTSSSGSNDVFIIKTNSSGTPQWAKKAGGNKEDRGRGVVSDGFGNIYVAGTFTQNANFSGTNISSAGLNSAFLAKYDDNGNFDWVTPEGGCCDTTRYNAVTTDEDGNIYTTGYYMTSTTIGTHNFTPVGSADILVVKYDPNGNVLWARSEGGPYEDIGYSCRYDARQHLLYVTGQIDDHGDFDGHYVGAAGNRDIFIAAYDTSGHIRWVKSCGGVQRDVGQAISFDTLGSVYTTGFFQDTAFFGSYTRYGYPLADIFVAKLSPQPAAEPTVNASAFTITKVNCNDFRLNWSNGNGARRIVIARAGNPVSDFPPDGSSYSASSTFGNGSNIGNGCYVVYDGTGSTVTVTGLSIGIRYYFVVLEYNGTGVMTNYYTTGYPSANSIANSFNITTSATPPAICNGSASSLHASNAVSFVWSPSSGLSGTTGATVSANPSSTTTYTVVGTDVNSCTASTQITLTVNQNPSVSFSSLSPVCVNASPVTLSGGSPSGGSYSGNSVSGGTFNPANSGVGTFIITYTYTDGNSCSNSANSSIQVHSLPNVSLSSFNAVCVNSTSFTLAGGTPSGGTYTGAGISNNTFDPSSAGSGTHTITYSYTNGNGCSNTATSSITVNALPNVTLGNFSPVCVDAATFTLSGGSPSGGNYSGNGVSGGDFSPNSAGIGTHTITYAYTDGNTCSNTATASITVRPLPTVTFASISDLCSNANPITLTGGSPSGGTYSGTGVSGNQFSPANSGTGTFTIDYNYTNANGCSNSAQSSVTVNPIPVVTFSSPGSVCANAGLLTLSGGSPAGGSYMGTGVQNGTFNPAVGVGSYSISYSYTDNHNCSGNASASVTVKPIPSLYIGADTTVCTNNSITLSGGSGFTSYSWSTGATTSSITIDSSGTGIGTKSVSLSVTNAFNCATQDTIQITFDPCSGVNTMENTESDVIFYPNPFSGTIQIISPTKFSYYIYDSTGKLLDHKENVTGSVMAGDQLASGIYHIEIRNNKGNKEVYNVVKADR